MKTLTTRFLLLSLLAGCHLFLPGAGGGTPKSPAPSGILVKDDPIVPVVMRLEARYREIRNFKARFLQENRTAIPGRTRKSHGTVAFARPGKIRWDYEAPPQKIIIAGDQMWTVKPALNQVVIQKLASAVRSRDVIALLTGAGALSEMFEIGAPTGWKASDPPPGTDAVELVPKDTNLGLSRIILLVSRDDTLIRRSYLFDTFGNVTRIDYEGYTIDTNVFPDDFFHFTPPPGDGSDRSPLLIRARETPLNAMTRKVCMISLGCPKNLVDSEVMLGTLARARFEISPDPESAEIIVVNTCGFIEGAKEESIEAILEAARHKEEGRAEYLVVAGCLAQRYADELAREIPEVDLFIGTGEYHRIAELIAEREDACSSGARIVVGRPRRISTEMGHRLPATPPHTTYLKIAEGCSRRCSFCIIPRLRGGARSRPVAALVEEARAFARRGTVEFNLVAQDLTSYGRDLGDGTRLADLLSTLVEIPEIRWIRLLYCYPWGFDDELLALIRNEEKICNYIDLPLQHIDDALLASMRRDVTRAEIERLLLRIREAIPGVVLRTSFIVGFPGETEAHFEELLRFVQRERFDRVGVFTYSPEEGTPSFHLPGRVPKEVMEARRDRRMAAQA